MGSYVSVENFEGLKEGLNEADKEVLRARNDCLIRIREGRYNLRRIANNKRYRKRKAKISAY